MSLVRPSPDRSAAHADDWLNFPVSSRSCFGDDVWHLDIFVAGRPSAQNRIRWDLRLPEGARITGAQHVRLIHAAKQYLWSMALHPPAGRKRSSTPTLQAHGLLFQVIIGWMAVEGIAFFRDITPEMVERLMLWLRARPGKGRKGKLSPTTVGLYLNVINTMFLQRGKLDDAPLVNPLPGETTLGAAGASATTMDSLPFIPDAVAVDLLSKALTWVEVHSDGIIGALEVRERTVATARADGWGRCRTGEAVVRALQHAAIAGPDKRPLAGIRTLNRCVMHLSSACFVLIAGFVGMRISEILSMQVGAVERHPIGETGVEQAYVIGRVFKTSDDPKGQPARWVAPEPVVRAVECLERLSCLLREGSKDGSLFLVKNGLDRGPNSATKLLITWRLQQFARHIGVPLHEGRIWPLQPHQFRKTFARFVARGDRSQLLALAEHFKHASVAMTSRGYVGTDFELHELVDKENQTETALALERILSSGSLGGRMGERLMARNHAFRGRAGEQVRRDYIEFVLTETDLRVRGCDYGWCVFQAETALCGGEVAPREAGRGPSVCAKCSNLVVDDRHVPYWQDRRRRNEVLSVEITSPLIRAVLAGAVEECDRVLRPFKGGRDGNGENTSTSAPGNSSG